MPEPGGDAIEETHQLFEELIIKQSLHDDVYLFKMYSNRAQRLASHHHHQGELEAQREKGRDDCSVRRDSEIRVETRVIEILSLD